MADGMADGADMLRNLRLVTTELLSTRQRLAEVNQRAVEPIAVVGIGCRFPGGVGSAEQLWDLVSSGVDAVSGFPTNRGFRIDDVYDPDLDRPGTTTVREGAFVHDADRFDAAFFGINPREAVAMDPQQRLLLETAWAAVEGAGIDPMSLRGTDTAVYAGVGSAGYGAGGRVPDELAGYVLTGNTDSVLSGRVSYALGLEGPAVTVETACSSSLVAMHLAAQALRRGECTLALAGGVAVLSNVTTILELSRQRGLAADGRCKAFADDADGMGWGEGCGVLVLERLSIARANGHRVLAVIRGSAINQDGASNGLTAPSGPAQRRVIQQALTDAGLAPSDVDAVEAHGTGTRLGDPIEAQALLETYGRDRDRPLWLGSVKSNIGHTQAAAGAAGVVKMIMAMRHELLPATLHIDRPTTHVDWTSGAVSLLVDPQPWPRDEQPRRAGVSSFGISGTNAHLILEEPPDPEPTPEPPRSVAITTEVVPLLLSARGEGGLRAQAKSLGAFVGDQADLGRVAWSLSRSRAGMSHRAVVLGADRETLLAGLAELADPGAGAPVSGVAGPGAVVFVFPGQGSQWAGMGRELLAASPVFAESVRACEEALAPFVDWSLREVLTADEATQAALLDRIDVLQPVLWAVMVSLAALWRACGVEPAAVVGHSQGEIAAACVAGGLSLRDGARIVALRSKVWLPLVGKGGMVWIGQSVEDVAELIRPWDLQLAIAAVNAPTSVVVAGDIDALEELLAWCEQTGVPQVRRLTRVTAAGHSPQVVAMREEVLAALAPLTPESSDIPMYSTVTGTLIDTAELDAAYWYRNLREPVRFQAAVEELLDRGHTMFLEANAHPLLGPAIQETADSAADQAPVSVLDTLRRDEPAVPEFVAALGRAYVTGLPVDWTAVLPAAEPVELPTYPFQRQRFWMEPAPVESTSGDRYRVDWTPVTPPGGELSGTWLVLTPADPPAWTFECRTALAAGGATVLEIPVAAGADRAALAAALPNAVDVPDVAGVVSFAAATPDPAGVMMTVAVSQALGDRRIDAPLWVVTNGAVAVEPAEGARVDPWQAALWGLGRVIALEHPDRWGGLIDVPADLTTRQRAWLTGVLAAGDEDQVAIRSSGVYASRLHEHRDLVAGTTDWRLPGGAVLITGGTGTLGTHVARWVARRGAEHVVLASRRGPDAPGAATLADELRELGIAVDVVACDLADPEAVAELVATAGHDCPLRMVVHAAGVLDDALVDELTPTQLAAGAAAKAVGAGHLDRALADLPDCRLVVFAAISALTGLPGHGNHAPWDAVMAALAAGRRATGRPATTVAWGPWQSPRATGDTAAEDLFGRYGLSLLPPVKALAALERALATDDDAPLVAEIDWERFATAFASARRSPLLADLARAQSALAATAPGPDGGLRAQLAGLGSAEAGRVLLTAVRTQAAAVLGLADPGEIAADLPFREVGFDSLTAMEFRNRLVAATGVRLMPTAVFDYPTPTAMARHLRDQLSDAGPAPAVVSPDRVREPDEPIAIVGMGCRFPGGVGTPEDLWTLVAQARDAMGAFPGNRGWDLGHLHDADPDRSGRTYVRGGGFLYDADLFDATFFGISPREALAMDPQQRLVLETAWEALESAGLDPTALRGSDTGAFVGMTGNDYESLLRQADASTDNYLLTGAAPAVASGRLAYVLGLEGPAMTVDTACSSALVAVHLAVQALRRGECSLALAGGVSVMSTTAGLVGFSRQRGLSPTGRCRPFSDDADGTMFSEGAGLLVLEPLSLAEASGHRVLAVVRGTAVNQDGASNGLTAPNGLAQQRVVRAALADAGLVPSDVDVVEAHGTGTTLGDPIEAQALLATYGQDRDVPLWLGSVKSNLGHTLAAAGVAGMIKMVQALRHETLPPTLYVEQRSSHVDWAAGAVRLLTENQPWPGADRPRRAGVSAFGVSGTNAHVILEEAPAREPADGAPSLRTDLVPWLVSARGEAGLRGQASRLLDFARAQEELDTRRVGRSLATGRAASSHRAVVFGASREELLADLSTVADGAAEVSGVVVGSDPGGVAFVFPGQGVQWAGMGRDLYAASPAFAAVVDEVAEVVDGDLPEPLRDVLFGGDDLDTRYAQLGLFTVGVGLAAVLREASVVPDVVLGHSVGEIAAACVAGVLSLADGARMVAARGRLMADLPGSGVMASVRVSETAVRELLAEHPEVAVAAVNGPEAVAVSGPPGPVEAAVDALDERGIRTRWLAVDHAFHSPLMDPVVAPFTAAVAALSLRPPAIPVISTVTGAVMTAEQACSPDYWAGQVRAAVRFADAVETAAGQHVAHYVELGPGASSSTMVRHTVDTHAVSLWRKPGDEVPGLVQALAELWVHGVPVDWTPLLPPDEPVDLPTYAFQRDRYWLEVDPRPADEKKLDSWRYRVDWVPVPAEDARLSGAWLVFVPDGPDVPGWVPECVTALRAAGAEVSEIPLGMDVDRGAVAAALAGHADVDGVVSLAAALPGWWPGAPGVPNAVVATVALVQGLGDAGLEAPLWTVTGGAVVTSQDDGAGDPVQAAVWGLGRVAALEHPDRWGGLVDVASGHADRLASVLSGVEDQVAIRSTGTYARRLRENPYRGPAEWRPPGGTVLITGGTGGLGGHTARWVAGRGAERVVLASRSGGRAPGADALVDELRAAGVDVEVVACDLTDRDAVAALLEIADADRPLRMVVHAAGVGQLGALDDLTTAEAAEVMAAKVLGARHLDDCLGDRELAAFLVFSSVSGVWGSGAQPAYAAANAYLDGVVAGRRARGLAGTSVAWGPWAGAGMAEHADLAQYERRGLPAMAPETAVTALEQALAAGDPTLVVADVDWSRFHPTFTAARPSPLLTGFGRNAGSGGRASGDRLRAHVAGLPADEAESHLVGLVRGHAAAVLGFAAPEAVDTTHGFLALGLDSVGAVEFRDRLVRVTGLDITATVVYDHPTITAVARHLADRLSPAADTFDAIVSTLDSLDRSLDALSGAGQRAELAHRLSALAERLDRDTGSRSADDVSKTLNDATGDELREFLSNEFGIA